MIRLTRDFWRNGLPHREVVRETDPGKFRLSGVVDGRHYTSDVCIAELCRASNDVPWVPVRM
jgi:hypothetical protein